MTRTLLLIVLLGASASACASAQARATPATPPLDVPAPPPRAVDVTETEPPPGSLAEEPARHAPGGTARRPAPPPSRLEPARPEPPKPEPQPTEPAKPVVEAPKQPTTLQTTPPGAEGDVERAIRAVISRATSDLSRIDYRALNTDARAQYDTAKRFVTQADEALRAKNLVFAKTVADKAAALAAQLAGR